MAVSGISPPARRRGCAVFVCIPGRARRNTRNRQGEGNKHRGGEAKAAAAGAGSTARGGLAAVESLGPKALRACISVMLLTTSSASAGSGGGGCVCAFEWDVRWGGCECERVLSSAADRAPPCELRIVHWFGVLVREGKHARILLACLQKCILSFARVRPHLPTPQLLAINS